jgi:predicted GNAT family N-acyltransferase
LAALSIHRIIHERDLKLAFELRKLVFMDEQGVSEAVEFDGLDDHCQHLLAMIEDKAVGTLRLRPIDRRLAKIERVVVSKQDRGRRIGAGLMTAALTLACEGGFETVSLHAQTQAQGFYVRLGFKAHGDIFDEDGIPHVAMVHQLA